MKFGQLLECNVKNTIFKNHVENETERLVQELFLFCKKVFNEVKAIGQHLCFNIFW